MRISTIAALSALSCAHAGALHAQNVIMLDEVIVSGGLTPVEARAYGRAFSIVTADEIEARQLREVSEVLRALPGVAVSRTGGSGGPTQVRIRGSEGNHVLVLVDGVEVSSPQNGEYEFAGLLAADIERVEVLRGPQSSLYGSNAMAGVISIITKGGRRNSFDTGAEVEGGTNESGSLLAWARGGTDKFDASLSLAASHDGGFDISGDPGGADDTNDNLTLNLKANGDIAEDARIGGTFRFTDRDSDADQFNFGAATVDGLVTDSDDSLKQREIFISLYADFDAFGGRLEHGPRATFMSVDTKNFAAGAKSSDTEGERFKLSYQGTVALDGAPLAAADHRLTLLGEFESETFENVDPALIISPSQLGEQSRDLFGFAAEYRGSFFEALDIQLGLRHDFNDKFKDATTFSAGASYHFASIGARLHASLGRGVTNPTFFEQFGFIPATFVGDPSLKPEESFGWDVGVEQRLWDDRVLFDVTYFNERLKNEIITVFGPAPTFLSAPANAPGKSDRQGIEIGLSVTPLDGLDLQGTYTYTDAEDAAGLREVRRPEHEGSLGATYRFAGDKAMIGADMRFVMDNYDTDFTSASFGAAQAKLDDYAVFGVRASYRFSDNAEVFGRIENLTNRDYAEVDGYNTRGITGFAGVRLRW